MLYLYTNYLYLSAAGIFVLLVLSAKLAINNVNLSGVILSLSINL